MLVSIHFWLIVQPSEHVHHVWILVQGLQHYHLFVAFRSLRFPYHLCVVSVPCYLSQAPKMDSRGLENI